TRLASTTAGAERTVILPSTTSVAEFHPQIQFFFRPSLRRTQMRNSSGTSLPLVLDTTRASWEITLNNRSISLTTFPTLLAATSSSLGSTTAASVQRTTCLTIRRSTFSCLLLMSSRITCLKRSSLQERPPPWFSPTWACSLRTLGR